MNNWKATTLSGTTYRYREGLVTIDSARTGVQVIKVWKMMASKHTAPIDLPWVKPEEWEDTKVAVVGQHLYVGGKDEWRISTPIVKVEAYKDDQ